MSLNVHWSNPLREIYYQVTLFVLDHNMRLVNSSHEVNIIQCQTT